MRATSEVGAKSDDTRGRRARRPPRSQRQGGDMTPGECKGGGEWGGVLSPRAAVHEEEGWEFRGAPRANVNGCAL